MRVMEQQVTSPSATAAATSYPLAAAPLRTPATADRYSRWVALLKVIFDSLRKHSSWKAHIRNRGASPLDEIEIALVKSF